MPLVRIDALRGDAQRLEGLGRAVHEALIETIGIPADDFFQVLTTHEGGPGTVHYAPHYFGVDRDDGVVFVTITMRSGRTAAQKCALYAKLAELARKYTGTEPRNVLVALTENELVDWSFGEGVAQYADAVNT